MDKKYSVMFSKVENYFLQGFLHPIVLVFGVSVWLYICSEYSISIDLKYAALITYWGILGVVFKNLNPLYFVSTNFENSDVTQIILRYRKFSLNGNLESVYKNEESLDFYVLTKKGRKYLQVPISNIGYLVSEAVIEILSGVKNMNYEKVKEKFESAGLSANIPLSNDRFITYSFGSKPYYVNFKLMLHVLALLICYVLVFHVNL